MAIYNADTHGCSSEFQHLVAVRVTNFHRFSSCSAWCRILDLSRLALPVADDKLLQHLAATLTAAHKLEVLLPLSSHMLLQ